LLKKGSGSCSSQYLNSTKFEHLVIDKIRQHVLTEDNLRELVRMVNEEIDASAAQYNDELDGISTEIADVDKRLGRLYDAIETGKVIFDDLSERIQSVKQRKELLQARRWELEWQLKERRVELADPKTVKSYVDELQALLGESSLAERKSFIRSFVKEIVVTGDAVVLHYTIPLSSDGLTEEELGVPRIVHYGGEEGTRTPTPCGTWS
jgi:site-specific DNA recombinase